MRTHTLLLPIALAACTATTTVPTQTAQASRTMVQDSQALLKSQLRDPSSAQFQGLAAYKTPQGDAILCGQFNAKNGFGGYVGFRDFYMRYRNGALMHSQIDGEDGLRLAQYACRQAAQGSIKIPTHQAG